MEQPLVSMLPQILMTQNPKELLEKVNRIDNSKEAYCALKIVNLTLLPK